MRKHSAVSIMAEELGEILKGNMEAREFPLPKDAKYVSAYYDPETENIIINFTHKSFDSSSRGYQAPCYWIDVIKRKVKK